ncbi:LysR family transcriptional regulator [Microvirga puerhi]|uniref:LysR family transcriptional regulator n=1 Tax=Microvirga puerhi TaxID=2876078 RepID=A0ABS7VR67_9HYPH|nr:LysR family transcriptional regulator [Microvirga puerhi]MBZ6078048.1 LysR family transcriptional regulator [Microvirga puerhi]
MNLTLLRAFHQVGQEGSFTRAAIASGVSQSTLSAHVRALEAAYSVNLFDRRYRGVTLTPIGQNLLSITTRLFAAEDEAAALLGRARNLTHGHLRVAADSANHVMPLLVQLKADHPGLTFSLTVGNSADVLQQILDYKADVGVMAKSTSDPRIHSLPLRVDKLVLFVPKTHDWGHRNQVLLEEINGRALVIRERGSITREVFEAALSEKGIRPGSVIEVQTREAVQEAVLAGFGIGIVFESEVRNQGELHTLKVDNVPLSVEEYVVCLEERRRVPLVFRFLDIAEKLATPLTARSFA